MERSGATPSWSPTGTRIAYLAASGALEVVAPYATRTARWLLELHLPYDSTSVAWSPSSRQLLAVWRPPTGTGYPSGLRRVTVDGTKPRLIHCLLSPDSRVYTKTATS